MPLEQFFSAPRERGAAVGLTFNFDQIDKAPNTLLAHRLVYLAPPAQRGALLDALYSAYFELGRDVGDVDTLADIATAAGLADAGTALLNSDIGTAKVLADVDFARQVGISGVPFFIVNDRLAFSGAQPPATILRVLRQAAADA